MKLEKAIRIKQKYQYILQDASLPELIEADNISIEALKRCQLQEPLASYHLGEPLPGETET